MSPQPLLLDLCCGLGGWARGFIAEGWDAVGVDILDFSAQYPGRFIQADLLIWDGYRALSPRLKQIAVTVTARSRSAAKRGTAISHVPQNAAMRSTSLALPKLPAQNAAEPTPPAQSPSGAPGTAAGPFSTPYCPPQLREADDDNCPF